MTHSESMMNGQTISSLATASSSSPVAEHLPLLEVTTRDAGHQVAQGIDRLRAAVVSSRRRHPRLAEYAHAATRELYRTYTALMIEASRIGRFGAEELGSLTTLQRSRLVTRVHHSIGNFVLIEKLCQTLQPHAAADDAVAEVEDVLRGFSDREVHLFGMLVPMATYADDLCTEVRSIVTLPSLMVHAIESRCLVARRAINPVYRHLARTTRLLQEFADELKRFTADPGASVERLRTASPSSLDVDVPPSQENQRGP